MKKLILSLCTVALLSMSLISCTQVSGTRSVTSGAKENDLTVGKVQREIKKGMTGAEVIEALGQPNIVTKDEQGRDTWVYDKIATEATYTESSNVLFLVLYAQANNQSTATLTQKTLTVVIKLNPDQKVESFTYHASKF